jgi:hypothetical protein
MVLQGGQNMNKSMYLGPFQDKVLFPGITEKCVFHADFGIKVPKCGVLPPPKQPFAPP